MDSWLDINNNLDLQKTAVASVLSTRQVIKGKVSQWSHAFFFFFSSFARQLHHISPQRPGLFWALVCLFICVCPKSCFGQVIGG